MKIYTGSDHAGLPLKRRLMQHLKEQGHEVVDLGTDSEASCDYSDYAHAVAKKVAAERDSLGLLTCGSGIGMSITANRHHGVRAALCHNSLEAALSRQHNNANVLVLGGRIVGDELAIDVLNSFLKAAFEGGRHARRVDKIEHV